MLNLNNDNKIVNSNLSIGNNVFEFDNAIIQMSCVCTISVAAVPKKQIPKWAIIAIIIGGLLAIMGIMNLKYGNATLFLFGAMVTAVGCAGVWLTNNDNNNLGDFLNLELNSGRIISFKCKDKEFLIEVLKLIKKEMDSTQIHSNVIFDFNNSKIINSDILSNSKITG